LNLIIFEDHNADGFYPLSVSHPVFDLFCGCFNVVERLKHYFKPDKLYLSCRDYLVDVTRQRYGVPVNDYSGLAGETIIVNAAAIPDPNILQTIEYCPVNALVVTRDSLVGGKVSSAKLQELSLNEILENYHNADYKFEAHRVDKALFGHLWDIVNYNPKAIENDLTLMPEIREWKRNAQVAQFSDDVHIHPSAFVQNGAYIDSSGGPVIIDHGAKVEPRSLIQGPAYIGKNSVVMAGMIREGCSLGPVCKVGGELEESIILGYSNKCHEGFIGHAYLGEWVNLGALTTNSDLKNNYGEISVSLKGKMTTTGSIKIGCFIGDHTKTGIGTTLNTGIVIGFSNNLYGGSLFVEKEIGHFKWGTPGQLVDYRVDKAMEVAKAAMSRRGRAFDSYQQALFDRISKM
jgi:UDP-N-acetylglucosamine diphosphorylase/glucosamine-1-phosphate N-acetyltransferase